MQKVKVEIISDYICPWCYLGKVRLAKLQDQLKHEIQITFDIKPFVLYPHIPLEGSPKSNFATKTKPGMGKSLRSEAKLENVELNYRLIEKIPSSLEAHRLTWLLEEGQQKYQLATQVFYNYFEKGKNIGDQEYLIQLAHENNLNESVIHAFANSRKGAAEVAKSIQESKEEFISVVPSIRLNDKFLIPGLQNKEVWEKYLRRAAKIG